MTIGAILDALIKVLPNKDGGIALHEPCFDGREMDYVQECIRTRWVSSVGKYVDQFEKMLADFTGVKRVIAVVNGTAALHVAMKLIGVKENDEVLMPTQTFVATANVVSYLNAIPHFVDSEEKTLGLDPMKLEQYLNEIADTRGDGCYNRETGRKITAVIPVHLYGHPVDLDPLIEVCTMFKLEMIEDATESLGSFYKKRHTGNWGKLSALSFNGNKIITTGGGGAILTNNEALGRRAKHITSTARLPKNWNTYHDEIGFNYRMPNLNAALGCAQLEKLPKLLRLKRELAEKYQAIFTNIEGVTFFSEPNFSQSNYWLNTILVEDGVEMRNKVLEKTNNHGIQTRPAWTLMHRLPMYKECPRMDLSNAERLAEMIVNLPSSSFLSIA